MRLLDLNGEPMDGWHPFSISSSSNDPYLELCIKSLGDFTKRLLNLGPGMEVEIEGAYGRFSFVNYKLPRSGVDSWRHWDYAVSLYAQGFARSRLQGVSFLLRVYGPVNL